MIRPSEAQARAWMAQWRSAGPALARVRAVELRMLDGPDLARIADELEEALWARRRSEPESATSGLVEQQRLFGRGRAR